MNPNGLLGRNPDDLSLTERRQAAGSWIALRRYTPANLALKRIEAVGDSPAACIRTLREDGKDPAEYQLILLGSGV